MANEHTHAVLLVEDDAGLRYAMATALGRHGFKVDESPDGTDAIGKINSAHSKYCCVVLDMLVPNVHGSSILSHVARVSPKLPIVAVTGYPDRVLFADQTDRRVVKAIFVKPVDPNDVAAYLESRCSHEEL